MIKSLRPFHGNMVTELRKNPKIYFYDAGLRNYSVENFAALETRSDKDQLAETFAFRALHALLEGGQLNFWRTTAKAEVDFVVSIGKRIVPVEVKFEKFKSPCITKSMHSFISTYSPEFAVVATKDFWGEMLVGKTKVKFVPLVYL